ncbi:hypothetical protein ALC62_02083 [Cyphomyrmex costatus]|uniref:Uncharacterized protein n=1 Tax=Cyphomyrmex costatus TaxID=456900 RepID=A0A151INB3_9HYME|nr:hypothetical protein ALC62_02083 [Cyphomyrmex costatus]
MAGSSEVTGMKCMDWFSLGRLPRNWHRQQVMDYRARPFCEFPRRVRALKTLPVSLSLSLALMLLMLFDKLPSTYRLVNIAPVSPVRILQLAVDVLSVQVLLVRVALIRPRKFAEIRPKLSPLAALDEPQSAADA